jgi:hypothetical protein
MKQQHLGENVVRTIAMDGKPLDSASISGRWFSKRMRTVPQVPKVSFVELLLPTLVHPLWFPSDLALLVVS